MRRLLPLLFLVACGDPTDVGGARVFRDNFDARDTLWTLTGQQVEIAGGMLRMTAGAGVAPLAGYRLPGAFGPGWDFEVRVAAEAGSPCSELTISTGDSRRHTWFLQMDAERNYWGLKVGDGRGWQTIASSLGRGEVPEAATTKLLVTDNNRVGLWIEEDNVLDTVIQGAATKAVNVGLGASRCNIIAGRVVYDWVQLKELEDSE